jgi:Uma2 family endonuclease
MPAVLNRGVTLDEFVKMQDPPDGSQLELFNGEVITLPPPKGNHGIVCAQFARVIGNYADDHKLGHVASNDTGVVIVGERDSLRGVDVGFWSFERHPHVPSGYFDTVPDLAIEVLPPNYSRRMIREKVK